MNVGTNVSGLTTVPSVNPARTGAENAPLILEKGGRLQGMKCCGCRPLNCILWAGTGQHGAMNIIVAATSLLISTLAVTLSSIDCNRRPGKAMGALSFGVASGAGALISASICQYHVKRLEPHVSMKKAFVVKVLTVAMASAGIALSVFSAITMANCKEP